MSIVAHMPLLELAGRLSVAGLYVEVLTDAQGKAARNFASPRAEQRGRTPGYYRGCHAVVMHHTGSTGQNPDADIEWIDGMSGRDPGFVIANGHIAPNGTVTLIASGPTYTEGAGGPRGLIPAGRANDIAFSYELGGRNTTDYPHAQQDAAVIAAAVTCRLAAEVWKWHDDPHGPTRLFTHHEWAPDRKVDVGGLSRWTIPGDRHALWDFDLFRADARNYREEPTTMPTPRGHYKFVRIDGYLDQFEASPISAETKRRMGVDETDAVLVVDPAGHTRAELEAFFGYQLTPEP